MKSIRIGSIFLSLSISILILSSCTKEDEKFKIVKNKLSGYVQKGPYVNGTLIQMAELDASLSQTGKVFNTQITNNKGSFELDSIALSSQYVEFIANGYYFNEVTGNISPSPLSLSALSDITDLSTVNVNILTHLEKTRVEYLIGKGLTFNAAKDTAQKEVLAIFGFQADNIGLSEELDISQGNDNNAILLAISLILQGSRSVGDFTELLANISSDLRTDGKMQDLIVLTDLRNSAVELNVTEIRTNLQQRYSSLGVNATIPAFETYINKFLVNTGGLLPTVISGSASDITSAGATIHGEVNANNLVTNITFEYGTSNQYGQSIVVDSPVSGNTNTSVSANLTDLIPGTTYYFRIRATSRAGTTLGPEQSFVTRAVIPTLSTTKVYLITLTSAKGEGSIISNGGSAIIARGLCWSKIPEPTVDLETKTSEIDNIELFTSQMAGLESSTTYYVRAYAQNDIGTAYGNEIMFRTQTSGTVTDIDGNIYKTITMGNQDWMAENLKVTKFNDGTEIPNITDGCAWYSSMTPEYCWYNDEISNKNIYGGLYNWHTVNPASNSDKNVCPTGWHVPTAEEWNTMEQYLIDNGFGYGGSGKDIAKSLASTSGWNNYDEVSAVGNNQSTNNLSGFSALATGGRVANNSNCIGFWYIGENARWWCSPVNNDGTSWIREISFHTGDFIRFYQFKEYGQSIRCVKD